MFDRVERIELVEPFRIRFSGVVFKEETGERNDAFAG